MKISDVSNSCSVPQGILLVIGGKEDKGEGKDTKTGERSISPLEILGTFVTLMDKDEPVVEVISSGSSEGEESFEDYKKAFGELNIKQLGHIHHDSRKQVMDDDLMERLQRADGFFFTGGDQLKLTSIYGGTSLLTVLKERYIKEKIVIAGTSAGAMAMSTPMIYAGNKQVQQKAGSVKVTTGLEFLKDVCIDTHFIDRSRFVRMAQVIATNPTSLGIGIEEDTALIVREGSKAEVVGNGIITIIEGFFITKTNITEFSEDRNLGIQDLKVHLLPAGWKYEIPQINPPHR